MARVLGRYKYLIIIIIVFIFYNSFFINKALHIDDIYSIVMGKLIINPFKASKFLFNNPPFLAYYYAPIVRIFGEGEPWLHTFYFPFSLLAIVSMFFLCLRFAKKSLFPVLFLISTPAFIISSQSIMLDIPLLGFFLAAVTTFIYGLDKDNDFLLISSGLLAGAAILTKYSGLMVIPILFIYALLNSGKKKTKFLLIPISIFLLWNVYCTLLYREAIVFSTLLIKLKEYFLNSIGIRIFASLSFLSGTSVVILFLTPLLLQKRNDHIYFFLSLVSGFFPFIIKDIFSGYSFFEKWFLAILFVVSTYIILLIFRAGARSLFKKDNKDALFLSAWFFLMFAFNILTNFIAARFSLLLLPPLFLFIYNKLSSCNFEIVKAKVKFVIFISVIFSTVLAIGDYQFAGLYRDFVYSFEEKIPLKEKEKIYFYQYSIYDSWGYAYYLYKFLRFVSTDYKITDIYYEVKEKLNRQDSIFVTPTEPVLPIVIEKKSAFDKFLDLNYDKILIKSIYYRGNVILHNRKFHTGFYCHDWGLLPFYLSIRKVPLEGFEIYRLSYSPR